MMKLNFISDVRSLDDKQLQWDSIAGQSPFYSYDWLMNWFRHLGSELQLALLVAEDEDQNWIGIAPWCIDESLPFTRKLRFLGSGTACSDYLDLICRPEREREFSEAVVDWLIDNIGDSETLGRIDVIEFEGITPHRPSTEYICKLFDASGFKSHVDELESGWGIDLPETWNELNATFSKSMKRKTKKAVQRFADPGTTVRSSGDEPLDQLWPIFRELHQQRRHLLGQPGCFADPAFEAFLKGSIDEMSKKSKAELIVIEHAEQPLASMVLLNNDDTVLMYQSGVDTKRMKMEPGYQMAYCAIERSITKGFQHFDFLRGDEPYKARWNTKRIPIHRIRFIPRNSVASFKHGLWLTGRTIKNYVRSVASAPMDQQ